jgi:hypothetical protein
MPCQLASKEACRGLTQEEEEGKGNETLM